MARSQALLITKICLLVASAVCFLSPVQAREKEWYETTTMYQIYPRSFKDSDGDGVGDLKGIREKLDYLHDIGIETVWIQPFYKSPMVDFGYDVSDYRAIDPIFGTMDDFKCLIKEIHDKGMKLVVDFVPNHTSDEMEWFKKSVDKVDPYTDYYVWKPAKDFDAENRPIPPNNWLSLFGGSSWSWNEKRRQFYFRQFSAHQPDLDFRNPAVREAIKDVLRFWLNLGVDGVRVDAVSELMEDEQLRDNPWVSPEKAGSTNWMDQIRLNSASQNDTYQLLADFRAVLDEYIKKDGKTRMMILETYEPIDRLIGYFSPPSQRTTNFPNYFALMYVSPFSNASTLDGIVHRLFDRLPPNGVPNWAVSNHDARRIASRVDPVFSEAMIMLELLLPGMVSVYYGDEIQMKNAQLRPDQSYDSRAGLPSRDVCRTPMQWDDSTNAGFTTKDKPWLPVNPEYWCNNVKQMLQEPHSQLNFFKRLVALRKTPVFRKGQLITTVLSSWVYMFERRLEGHPSFLVIINVGSESESVCVTSCSNAKCSNVLQVHTGTANAGYKPGDKFTISTSGGSRCSILRPKAGIVLTSPDENSSSGAVLSQSSLPFLILIAAIAIFR